MSGYDQYRKQYRPDHFVEYTAGESALLREFDRCINCGICLSACVVLRNIVNAPIFYSGPRSIAISLSRSTPEFWTTNDDIYLCTMCGACEAACPSNIPIPDIVAMIRAKIPQQEPQVVPKAHAALAGSLASSGTIYGEALEPFGHRRPDPEYVYFTGCVGAHLERDSVENTLELLDRLGVSYTTIDEVCCGGPAHVAGVPMPNELAETNLERILATGTNKVITSCPRCYTTFAKQPVYQGKLQAEHVTTFLKRFDWGALTDQKVTYHDPCELGRHLGEYESARQVLHQVAPGYVEMPDTREKTVCCGAGGGLRGVKTRLSINIGRTRLEEAIDTGAEVIITECASCLHNFANARRSADTIEIYNLSEYLNRLLKGSAKGE